MRVKKETCNLVWGDCILSKERVYSRIFKAAAALQIANDVRTTHGL